MKILFDQRTPAPLRHALEDHAVETAYELGWSTLQNGELLSAAERAGFDMLLTTDKNMRYQQNGAGRRIAVVILPTTSWPRLQRIAPAIVAAVSQARAGGYTEVPAP